MVLSVGDQVPRGRRFGFAGRSPMLQTRRVGSVAAAQRCTKPAAYKIELLTRIQAPTLIMFGRDDRVTPLDNALTATRLIRKCELHVFYDAVTGR